MGRESRQETGYRVRARDGTAIDPYSVIFPILKRTGGDTVRLVGTGFFITNLGHFVTAKHVIEDVLDHKSGRQTGTLFAM